MPTVKKPNVAERYLRLLGKPTIDKTDKEFSLRPRGSEDPTAESPVSLSQADMSEKIARLNDRLEKEATRNPDDYESFSATKRAIVQDAESGLQKIRLEGPDADLTPKEAIGLEAIVETDGSRPSLQFVDGELALDDQELGDWKYAIETHRANIERAANSVGWIDLNGKQFGTGFSIGDGRIFTNRHVLQLIAEWDDAGYWQFKGDVAIDFGSGPQPDHNCRFPLRQNDIVAGDMTIDLFNIDFEKMDYAVLHCDVPDNGSFPPGLASEADPAHVIVTRPVYAIGYPGKPAAGRYAFDILRRIFNYEFGVKRFSPGEIDAALGDEEGDIHRTVMRYDSTTLPGSSGSAVIDVTASEANVVGLHFAGWGEGNYAHSLAASHLRDELNDRGVNYPIASSS